MNMVLISASPFLKRISVDKNLAVNSASCAGSHWVTVDIYERGIERKVELLRTCSK